MRLLWPFSELMEIEFVVLNLVDFIHGFMDFELNNKLLSKSFITGQQKLKICRIELVTLTYPSDNLLRRAVACAGANAARLHSTRS